MVITKETLENEIAHLQREREKALFFNVQAEAQIAAYTLLIRRLEAPEPSAPDASSDDCN